MSEMTKRRYARLTPEQWLEIEAAYRAGAASNKELAERYSCHVSSIEQRARTHGWLREPGEVRRQLVAERMAAHRKIVGESVAATIERAADTDADVLTVIADAFGKLAKKLGAAADALPSEAVKELDITASALTKVEAGYRRASGQDGKAPPSSFEDIVRRLEAEGALNDVSADRT